MRFYRFYFNFPTKDLIPLSIGESLKRTVTLHIRRFSAKAGNTPQDVFNINNCPCNYSLSETISIICHSPKSSNYVKKNFKLQSSCTITPTSRFFQLISLKTKCNVTLFFDLMSAQQQHIIVVWKVVVGQRSFFSDQTERTHITMLHFHLTSTKSMATNPPNLIGVHIFNLNFATHLNLFD